jgi:hypothetical protein
LPSEALAKEGDLPCCFGFAATYAEAAVADGSTGCKQTPNGLFIFLFKSSSAALASSLRLRFGRWNFYSGFYFNINTRWQIQLG